MRNLTILGNLGRDWEKRSTSAGDVYSTSVGVRGDKNRDTGKTDTLWFKCDAWGKTGESLAQYSKKGAQVCLSGEVGLETWDKDGKHGAQLKLRVTGFSFVSSGQRNDDAPKQSPAAALNTPPVDDDIPF